MKLATLLFAPGDSARKIAKALAADADGVVLDLEDSVAPANKALARASVAQTLSGPVGPGTVVRVNPAGSAWYLADLAATVVHRPAAVMLPKCQGPGELRDLDRHLEALEAVSGQQAGTVKVIALVSETARSVAALGRYEALPARVIAFCFGAEDLAADLGIPPRRADGAYPAPIALARAQTLIAAAANEVAALDTPHPDPRDEAGLIAAARAAAADGFAGKLLIHPNQIAPVRAAFTPPPERIAWARAVLAAFADPDAPGVQTLDGKMIEKPHVRLAERILAAI